VIPPLEPSGNLPPGDYDATWEEVVQRLGVSPWRNYLLSGLREAARSLAAGGCRRLWLDGSFTTNKEPPGDFDGCWDPVGVDPSQLDPVLFRFENQRAAQKAKFGGELFPATARADTQGRTFLQFFQIDKNTGDPKGIVGFDPRSVP